MGKMIKRSWVGTFWLVLCWIIGTTLFISGCALLNVSDTAAFYRFCYATGVVIGGYISREFIDWLYTIAISLSQIANNTKK